MVQRMDSTDDWSRNCLLGSGCPRSSANRRRCLGSKICFVFFERSATVLRCSFVALVVRLMRNATVIEEALNTRKIASVAVLADELHELVVCNSPND